MAGPIAVLAVRLSAQLAEFQESFKQANKTTAEFKTSFEKFAGDLQGNIDKVGKTFSQLGANLKTVGLAVAGVAAAGGVAIVAFKGIEAAVSTIAGAMQGAIVSTANLGDEFFTLGQKTGLSAEALSGFQFAAEQSGTSLDAITGAVSKLEANLGAGSKETQKAIKGIGLSFDALKAEAPEQAFQDILGAIGEIPNVSDRAAAGIALFGKSFQDISSLAAEGKDGIAALMKQAEELGLVISQKTAVAGDRFNDQLNVIERSATGLSRTLGAALLPGAVALAEVFGGIFVDAMKAVVSGVKGGQEGFDQFVIAVGEAAGTLLQILASMLDGVLHWAVELTKQLTAEAHLFADFAQVALSVGEALDLGLNQGANQATFDALEKRLAGATATIDSFARGIIGAGGKLREFAQGVAAASKTAGEGFAETFKRIQAEIDAAGDKLKKGLAGIKGAAG